MSDTYVELTELGRKRALDLKGKGPRQETLVALYENGRMTLEELESELDLDSEQTELVVRSLIKPGYVRGLS